MYVSHLKSAAEAFAWSARPTRSPGAHGSGGTVECRSLKHGGRIRDDKNMDTKRRNMDAHDKYQGTRGASRLPPPPARRTCSAPTPLPPPVGGDDAPTEISALYRTVGAPADDLKIAPSCTLACYETKFTGRNS